ncbi:MAG: rhodanese-like domain-containing protein [Bacteroidales bacterium]|nr:rhodanese-like domain-containing protein [Bacteroidales bacterium]
MSVREKLSVTIILLGVVLLFLPLGNSLSLTVSQNTVAGRVFGQDAEISADQVARMLVAEDSTLRIIDLRPADEYRKLSIPGAINIPYPVMLAARPETFLGTGSTRNIFYSNDDMVSSYALVLAIGMGYDNCYVMTGGLNEWIRTVMNSHFTGETITARENALFETRTRAAKLFREYNALPDSLKIKYLNSMRFDPRKLDGGCE